MKIIELNGFHLGSTGKIMFGIADELRKDGHEVWTMTPYYYQRHKKVEFPELKNHKYFGNRFENMLHLRLAQITGFHGCFSYYGTKQLLAYIDEINPDVIHLHNLHNWTINIPMLFSYIKKKNIKIIWTFHDCWPLTGQCPHFSLVKCDKWKTGCYQCPQIHVYPQAFVDRTKIMWKLKRKWFTNIRDMTIITPSKWLANLVKESFLSEYDVKVINNGIDTSVFYERNTKFRKKIREKNDKWKFLVLGVAFDWGQRKGLDVFLELSKRLSDDYKIVLVGTSDFTDKILPREIMSIHQTTNQVELAEIYSSCDVFVNPTREDNYPTVNMEALACGTPVVAFNTGGSCEMLDENVGFSVSQEDIQGLVNAIINICEEKKLSRKKCSQKGLESDQELRFREYKQLL